MYPDGSYTMADDPLWMTRRKPMHPYVEQEQQKIIHDMGIGKGTWTYEQILEREKEYTRRMTEAIEKSQKMETHTVSDTVPTVNIEDEPVWSDDDQDTMEHMEDEVEQEVMRQVRNTAASA